MAKLILHAATKRAVDAYIAHPSHALCLIGPAGAGKHFTALQLASEVLKQPREDAIYSVGVDDEAGIDAVRKLQRFLQLKTTGKAMLRRAVIVENMERMSIEAQNALLKTLEEPPEDTIFILTATNLSELRPTIRSRCQIVNIKALTLLEAEAAFPGQKQALRKAFPLSGGHVGLLHALLNDPDHELVEAVNTAKSLLGAPQFERLTMIDELLKSKKDLTIFFYALQRVLGAVLAQSKTESLPKLVQSSRALYEAEQDFKRSANPKLLLTDLFLHL